MRDLASFARVTTVVAFCVSTLTMSAAWAGPPDAVGAALTPDQVAEARKQAVAIQERQTAELVGKDSLAAAAAALKRSDFITAARILDRLAQANSPEAQFMLAELYRNGNGVPKSDAEALALYEKSAAHGFPSAENALGNIYFSATPRQAALAARWWGKAAEHGVAAAQFNLGLLLHDGEGVPIDRRQAALWYGKAAAQGMAQAQLNLGVMLGIGDGIEKNEVKGAEWVRKSAEQGFAPAQLVMGSILERGGIIPKSEVDAVSWYQKAADKKLTLAYIKLGEFYAFGKGVAQDLGAAYKWYDLAAAAPDGAVLSAAKSRDDLASKMTKEQLSAAQRDASFIFNHDVRILPGPVSLAEDAMKRGDYARAAMILRLHAATAEATGNSADWVGAVLFGDLLTSGNGVPQNFAAAAEIYRKAANAGVSQGQLRLAEAYASGRGVELDPVSSLAYYELAMGANDQGTRNEAVKARDALAATLTPDQIGEAKRRAAELPAVKN